MKKGRHRRFEEARQLKRSNDIDFDSLLDNLADGDDGPLAGLASTSRDEADAVDDDEDDPYDPYANAKEEDWR